MGGKRPAWPRRAVARPPVGPVEGRRETVVADAAIEAEGAAPSEAVEQVRPPIPLTARETPHEAAAPAPE